MGAEGLRGARHAAGLTVQELADEAGVHYATVSRIERGRQQPTREVGERLARALGLEADEVWPAFGWSRPAKGDTPLRRARLRRGLSQATVAAGAGVGLAVVRRAERGDVVLPVNARAIADFLGLDPEELAPLVMGAAA